MTEETDYINDLSRLRSDLTRLRREQARSGDADGAVESQRRIQLLEDAIEDENTLFRKGHKHLIAFI